MPCDFCLLAKRLCCLMSEICLLLVHMQSVYICIYTTCMCIFGDGYFILEYWTKHILLMNRNLFDVCVTMNPCFGWEMRHAYLICNYLTCFENLNHLHLVCRKFEIIYWVIYTLMYIRSGTTCNDIISPCLNLNIYMDHIIAIWSYLALFCWLIPFVYFFLYFKPEIYITGLCHFVTIGFGCYPYDYHYMLEYTSLGYKYTH